MNIIETNNLVIRPFTSDDLCFFIALIRDKMSSKMAIYDDQYPTDEISLKSILSYFCTSKEFFAVILKKENRLIGYVSLNYISEETRNLGYVIHSQYQNKGYGTEMVFGIKDYARNVLKVKKLLSGTALVNTASCRLLEKTGFVYLNQEEASFTTDDKGNKQTFIACVYECIL